MVVVRFGGGEKMGMKTETCLQADRTLQLRLTEHSSPRSATHRVE